MSAITWPHKTVSLGLLHARTSAHPLGGAYLADVLAYVLNNHFISSNGLHSKQAPVVNVALTEFELFLPKLREGRTEG